MHVNGCDDVVIRGAYISAVELDNVKVSGSVNGPLVRLWRADEMKPAVRVENATGVETEVRSSDGPWAVKAI